MTSIEDRISKVGLTLLASFLVVALMATYWQAVRAEDLSTSPTWNAERLRQEDLRMHRGRILDRNGEVLAVTLPMPDGTMHRHYPSPGAAHILGYHTDLRGDGGVEALRRDVLTGRARDDGFEGVFRDLIGLPRLGDDVSVTLDLRIQRVAEAVMGNDPGAAVALNPRTGEVLAFVSSPYFSPQQLDREWDAVRDDPAHPLLNRVTQGLYSPGSTFKTVTLAAALEAGLVDANTPVKCPPRLVVEGFPVNSRNEPPGKETQRIADAYAYSCNTAFAELGLKVGAERLTAMAEAFGLTEPIPFELNTLAGQLRNTPGYLGSVQGLAVTAFGQGQLQVTPLHLALMAAAVANGGVIPKPHLFPDAAPESWRQAMSPQTARALADIMEYSVGAGWASAGAVSDVRVAGKTGTAEVGDGSAHAVFIAFAPMEDPRIAVAVLKERAGPGSTLAGPAVRAILEAALK